MNTQDALDLANENNLQLVEVNPKANPPVCKVMDYGKFKYESAKRDRDAKRNATTSELKEVKFRPKTHGHDFDFKLRHVRRFLSEGDKVKLVVQFRGREVTHPETGHKILDRVCKESSDLATVMQIARMEGNRMNMVIAPKPGLVPKPKGPRTTAKSRESGEANPDAVSDEELDDLPPLEDLDDDDDDDDDDVGDDDAGDDAEANEDDSPVKPPGGPDTATAD